MEKRGLRRDVEKHYKITVGQERGVKNPFLHPTKM